MLTLPRPLLCAALFACMTASASAENAKIQLPLPGPADARAAAMGGAGAALLDGGVGFFHNPAHLGFGQGALFFGQTNLTGRADISFDPKGASYRWRGWGLAWGNRIGQTDGVFDHTYLSAARRIGRHASAGVSGKFWRKHPSERFQFLGHAPVFDVGALLLPSERWTVGARLSQTERGAGFEHYAVGSSLRLGRFLLAVEWDGGGRVGAEWNLSKSLQLRVGYGEGEPRVGVSTRTGPLEARLAWMRLEDAHALFIQGNFALIETP